MPKNLSELIGLSEQTRRVLKSLTPREEEVLRQRFEGKGLDKVTKERIQQIEAKAMRKLRHPPGAKTISKTISEMLSDESGVARPLGEVPLGVGVELEPGDSD